MGSQHLMRPMPLVLQLHPTSSSQAPPRRLYLSLTASHCSSAPNPEVREFNPSLPSMTTSFSTYSISIDSTLEMKKKKRPSSSAGGTANVGGTSWP
ncbi:hypothetical protein BGW80DRAFT_1277459, partial [Lactifluus volemus]